MSTIVRGPRNRSDLQKKKRKEKLVEKRRNGDQSRDLAEENAMGARRRNGERNAHGRSRVFAMGEGELNGKKQVWTWSTVEGKSVFGRSGLTNSNIWGNFPKT